MNVCINTRNLSSDLTGVQRYTLELLARIGDHVERISPSKEMAGIKGHMWEQFILPQKLRGCLLFSPSNTGPLIVRNQVVTIHDFAALDHPEWLNPRFAAWYGFIIPRLAARVAHIITISEFSKQRLLSHVRMSEDRITVIPNGVDPRFYPMDDFELSAQLRHLDLPSRSYVLCVGSLEPRKNLHRLIQAWAQVQSDIPRDVWLVITGKRSNRRVFASIAGLDDLPPRVHLTGHVEEEILTALYSGALIFAYPSLYEGFGLPPLEAMASGVPVLTGNQASLPEVVGQAGIMVDPFNVDAIADGLTQLINNFSLREQMRIAGLERARRFSWDITAAKTVSVLQRIGSS
ncbi:glycosyltransferase family 4 protein [Thioalkalivibrio sulfidiphilus]|uniref:glycosyltransferase family 4 protein n=1 Tax=Thioalkalivibrio sulfidiphilus TaxID=1033854 RepID=UPI003B31015F